MSIYGVAGEQGRDLSPSELEPDLLPSELEVALHC